LANKFIFSLLDLNSGLLTGNLVVPSGSLSLAWQFPARAFGLGLCSIKQESRVLNAFPSPGRKHKVGVQSSRPASKEAALDLGILGKSGFTNTLLRQGIFLKSSRKGIFSSSRMLLLQKVAAG
jgi:hypothetical protein